MPSSSSATSSSSCARPRTCTPTRSRTSSELDAACSSGLRAAGVRTTINTDGTYLLGTTLRQEFELLLAHGILDASDVSACIETARQATFVR